MTFWEEAASVLFLFLVLAMPLCWFFFGVFLAISVSLGYFSLQMLLIFIAITVVLAAHPLPARPTFFQKSWLSLCLYKYFSYRVVWCDDDLEKTTEPRPWIGAGSPHGVMPFANLLSIPAINSYFDRPFVGTPASIVFHTPFLRYMTLFGPCVDVSAASIEKALDSGQCVGTVPDGIAGIFRCNQQEEVLLMRNRKGLARLAVRTGYRLVPAYSIGNTTAFTAWFDSYGILESISRKAKSSLFLYWGRFYLPIPRRQNITLVLSTPIEVVKGVSDVDEVHNALLEGFQSSFELHKASLGWGNRKLRIE